jgi:hypothetical protein
VAELVPGGGAALEEAEESLRPIHEPPMMTATRVITITAERT